MSTHKPIKIVALALIAALLPLGLYPASVLGQSVAYAQTMAPTEYEKGLEAFRSGDYLAAERILTGIQKSSTEYADAQYLLGRIYMETDFADPGKASKAIDNALEVDPENVAYMVARLELLRTPSSNFIQERLKDLKRRELARVILKLDDKNAYAHEEMGISYINDYWRFRNAISIPQMGPGYRTQRRNEQRNSRNDPETQIGTTTAGQGINPADLTGNPSNPIPGNPDDFNLGFINTQISDFNQLDELVSDQDVFGIFDIQNEDQFDLEALRSQGVEFNDLRGRGEYAYQRAIGHLRQALVSDPRRESVYDELMRVYALKGDYAAAVDMLQTMSSFFPESLKTWLFLGLAQSKAGQLDLATIQYDKAFSMMPEEERNVFEDISLLLGEQDRQKYAADPVGFATRFWNSQNPRFLTPYNERRLEHYNRLVYADLLYNASKIGLRGWETQRGQILIRYGVPRVDIVLEQTGRTGGSLDLEDSQGFTPVDSRDLFTSDALFNPEKQAKLFNIWDYGDFRFVFEDPYRNGEYEFYSPSAEDIAYGVDPSLNDYVILAKNTFRRTPGKYTYEAPGRQVELPYLINTFKGENNLMQVYLHAGVPITEFDSNQDLIDINVNVGTFLIGSDLDILVERRQTLYGLKTAQIARFDEANLWVYSQEMNAPPGDHEVSVEFETTSRMTVGVQRRKISVPNYFSDELALSDAMLAYGVEESVDGRPVAPGDVVRNSLSIRPAPWSVFGSDQPIYIYFEVYNLKPAADGSYSIEIEAALTPKDTSRGARRVLRRVFGGGRKGVSVEFTSPVEGSDDGQYVILDASDQDTGLYSLVLRIRDTSTGKTVETRKDLFLE